MDHKTSLKCQGFSRAESKGQHGIALVLALSFMALLTIVVIAFLISSSNGHSISNEVQNNSAGKRLSEIAVQIVMGQIRQATSGGTSTAWASQPGMIRTYGNGGGASSQPLAYYKLYSSDNMVVAQTQISSFSFANEVPAAWQNQPAVFSDLNAPVLSASGTLEYPIIDPGAALTPSGEIASSPSASLVEGCSIISPPSYSGSNPSATNNPAPMPVKWVYVLRDGTLTVPTGVDLTGQIVNWTGATDPTKIPSAKDPIVARIAFWTDDETCKLNLNTAAGNNYWDTPMFSAGLEMEFSQYQPATNELTRYPGHPSTTSLLPVLWSYGGLPSPDYNLYPVGFAPALAPGVPYYSAVSQASGPSLTSLATTYFQDLMNLNPRTAWGGSQGGSAATVLAGSSVQNPLAIAALGTQRLYSSVDEMLYIPPRTSRAAANTNQFEFAKTDIDKLRFFLTTTSRAPEVNMFNLPKVSMWPVHDPTATNPVNPNQGTGTASQSPLDQLLAFCSTINSNAYYFTRNDPTNPTADISGPAAGAARNVVLYNYLRALMNQNIPGFGASLQSRYGTAGSDQILTECFDYIRSTINLADGSGFNDPSTMATPLKYSYTTPPGYLLPSPTYYLAPGTGQVAPTIYSVDGNTTKGMGRFPTIKQAAIMFIARAANQPPVLVDANGVATSTVNPMHPWVGMPAATVSQPSGVYTLMAPNEYPTLPTNPINTAIPTLATAGQYQTHAGLQYLTAIDPANGKFDLPNPRYPAILPQLLPYQSQISAILLIDPVNVAVGNLPMDVQYQVTIAGLDGITVDGRSMGFLSSETQVAQGTGYIGNNSVYTIGKGMHLNGRASNLATPLTLNFYSRTPVIVGPGGSDSTGQTFQFAATKTVTISIQTIPQGSAPAQTVQVINLNFPSASFPTPLLPIQPAGIGPQGFKQSVNFPIQNIYDLTPSWMLTFDAADPLAEDAMVNQDNPGMYPTSWSRLMVKNYPSVAAQWPGTPNLQHYFFVPRLPLKTGDTLGWWKMTADTVRSLECAYGDTRVIAALQNVPSSFFIPHKYYFDTSMRAAHSFRGEGDFISDSQDTFQQGATTGYLTNVRQLLGSAPGTGLDYDSYGLDFGQPTGASTEILNLPSGTGDALSTTGNPPLDNSLAAFPQVTSMADFNDSDPYWTSNTSWATHRKFSVIWGLGGDFDNGPSYQADGPYINKPNEGLTVGSDGYTVNFPDFAQQSGSSAVFPPNREISSSVMFGSLPVIMDKTVSSLASLTPDNAYFWRTLLFCPNPNSQTHPSFVTPPAAGAYGYAPNPPDFTFLDFFNMPAIEPYAISEPFSTAGRVNMNYQIAPFTYIKRDTAMRGVLRSTYLTAVPDSWMNHYKSAQGKGTYLGDGGGPYDAAASANEFFTFRYPIHPTQTLQQFDAKFNSGDIFRSPSEICSIWLYPATQPTAGNPTASGTPLVTDTMPAAGGTFVPTNIENWWYGNPGESDVSGMSSRKSLTGDNMRERPYSTLYPLLTTKSNSYTVHYRVQVLKKIASTAANQWVENQDQINSEYRGSSLIERYIDPNNPNLPDFAETFGQNPATAQPMDSYYDYHVLSVRKFSP